MTTQGNEDLRRFIAGWLRWVGVFVVLGCLWFGFGYLMQCAFGGYPAWYGWLELHGGTWGRRYIVAEAWTALAALAAIFSGGIAMVVGRQAAGVSCGFLAAAGFIVFAGGVLVVGVTCSVVSNEYCSEPLRTECISEMWESIGWRTALVTGSVGLGLAARWSRGQTGDAGE